MSEVGVCVCVWCLRVDRRQSACCLSKQSKGGGGVLALLLFARKRRRAAEVAQIGKNRRRLPCTCNGGGVWLWSGVVNCLLLLTWSKESGRGNTSWLMTPWQLEA